MNDRKTQATTKQLPLAVKWSLLAVVVISGPLMLGIAFFWVQGESYRDIYQRGRSELAIERLSAWGPWMLRPSHWRWLTAESHRKQRNIVQVKRIVDELNSTSMAPVKANAPLWLTEAASGSTNNTLDNLGPLLVLYRSNIGEVYSSLVEGLMSRGDRTQALQILKLWNEQDADNPDLYYWQGVTSASNYELEAATLAFREALAKRSGFTKARMELAEVLLEQAQLEEAKTEFEILIRELPSEPSIITGYARTLLNLGFPEEASAELVKLNNVQSLSSMELALICETNLEADNAQSALEIAKLLLQRWPNVNPFLELAARSQARLGNQELSAELFARAKRSQERRPEIDQLIDRLDNEPNNLFVRRQLGELMMNYMDPASGAGYFQVAVRMDPMDVQSHALLADYFKREKKTKQAEVHERLVRQLTPKATSSTGPNP